MLEVLRCVRPKKLESPMCRMNFGFDKREFVEDAIILIIIIFICYG